MKACEINCSLTFTEIQWIIMALNHDAARLRDEAEAFEGQGIGAVSELMMEDRKALAQRLGDIVNTGAKSIRIKY